ncbi:MAG: 2-dehydropantoate 2-reductase [Myxococcota bacterium]
MDTIDRRGRVSPPPTRTLLVGAGAVGQVYGYHLAQAGAHTSLLVRPKYADDCRKGLRLYEMKGKRGRIAHLFQPDEVFTSVADAAARDFDQIWLCLSTAALERALEDDLAELLQGSAKIIALQPGTHVPALLAPFVGDRMIDGGINMVAYQAPLVAGEVPEPGVAYYLPSASPFSGEGAEGVAQLLRAGGCPAKVEPNTRALMAYGTATLNPLITALQGAGWSLAEMRKGRWAKLGAAACAEARAITEAAIGTPPPTALSFLGSGAVRIAATFFPYVAPFELEIYLRYHFTKVQQQTRLLLDRYLQDGERLGVETPSLRELRSVVFA